MAERIVSPGVFTNENDQSFLAAGVGEIGAAFIGPTVKGPAFVPTTITSPSEFEQIFGGEDPRFFVPYSAKAYLKDASPATIVRVLGSSGYTATKPVFITVESGSTAYVAGVLHQSQKNPSTSLALSTIAGTTPTAFHISVSGSGVSYAVSASLSPTSSNFIGTLFSSNPAQTTIPAYSYVLAKNIAAGVISNGTVKAIVATDINLATSYSAACTPWIQSQKISGATSPLFKVYTLSHGDNANYEFKIAISNIKSPGSIPGTPYGSFTLTVRGVDQANILNSPHTYTDTDLRPDVVETYSNVNLDPNSTNFIARVIGDTYLTTNADGDVTANGNYPNKSAFIRLEMDANVDAGAASPSLVPFGFGAPLSTIPTVTSGSIDYFLPPAAYVTTQTSGGTYNKKVYFGFNYFKL